MGEGEDLLEFIAFVFGEWFGAVRFEHEIVVEDVLVGFVVEFVVVERGDDVRIPVNLRVCDRGM